MSVTASVNILILLSLTLTNIVYCMQDTTISQEAYEFLLEHDLSKESVQSLIDNGLKTMYVVSNQLIHPYSNQNQIPIC